MAVASPTTSSARRSESACGPFQAARSAIVDRRGGVGRTGRSSKHVLKRFSLRTTFLLIPELNRA